MIPMSALTPTQSRTLALASQNMSEEDRARLVEMDQNDVEYATIVRELNIDPPKLTEPRVTIETAADIMTSVLAGDYDLDTALKVLKDAAEANL